MPIWVVILFWVSDPGLVLGMEMPNSVGLTLSKEASLFQKPTSISTEFCRTDRACIYPRFVRWHIALTWIKSPCSFFFLCITLPLLLCCVVNYFISCSAWYLVSLQFTERDRKMVWGLIYFIPKATSGMLTRDYMTQKKMKTKDSMTQKTVTWGDAMRETHIGSAG